MEAPAAVEVSSPRIFGPIDGMRIRVVLVNPDETTVFCGLPVSTPAHTAWDLARWLPQMEAVKWIDALGRARALSRDSLTAHVDAHPGMPGSVRAAGTLDLCDPRAESPPESSLRVHLHLAGIPVVPQHLVMHGSTVIARADLALPDLRLAIEYDGQWHADRHQLSRDRSRLRRINQAGWHVYSVTREDMRDIDGLVDNIKAVVAALTRATAK